MKTNTLGHLVQHTLLAPLAALAAWSLGAVELKPFGTIGPLMNFYGFVSQGLLLSSGYNYLTPDSESGSLQQFTEVGLNVAMNPFPRTRIVPANADLKGVKK